MWLTIAATFAIDCHLRHRHRQKWQFDGKNFS